MMTYDRWSVYFLSMLYSPYNGSALISVWTRPLQPLLMVWKGQMSVEKWKNIRKNHNDISESIAKSQEVLRCFEFIMIVDHRCLTEEPHNVIIYIYSWSLDPHKDV